jgi:hypothetical protein
MMFCKSCGKQIEDDSRFCNHCGAQQTGRAKTPEIVAAPRPDWRQPPSQKSLGSSPGRTIGLLLAAVIALIFIGSLVGGSGSSTSSATNETDMLADNMEMAADNMTAIADGAAKAEPEAAWSYSTDVDKVRGGTSYFATTTSTNTIHQDPPYDSDTSMRMTVRRMPSSGTDVVINISSGQLMCPSYEGCSGTVRFDNGPAQRVRFNGPADSSSDTIFVIGAKAFVAKLKKAKKVIIEKTLYEAGNPQFEFDVSGLKWDH